jgi:hypothetical protein
MRKVVFVLGAMLCMTMTAAAQEVLAPKAEVFGGYSLVRSGGANLHGWNASVAGNVNDWFGVVGDFSGNYNSQSLSLLGLSTSASTSIYAYTFGPQVSYRRNETFVPFARALFGGARMSVDSTTTLPGLPAVTVSQSANGFASNIGGGLDWAASPKLSIRLIQADMMLLRSSGNTASDPRLSFGVVFKVNR